MKRSLGSALIILCCLFIHINCSRDNTPEPSKTFVLVHGAWQASYVWLQVKQGLEQAGHKVVLIELPAHGNDSSLPQNVSINVYRNKVMDAVSNISEKVILVGHSMGGVVVSAVAEAVPNRIEKLVFIGAFVPQNGQSLLDLANMDAQSHLGPSLIPSEDQLTLNIKHDSIVPVFCQDASATAQQLMLSKFRVEPAIPFTNKATITTKGFGSVDKYYIYTLQDHAIGKDLQHLMATAAHISKTYSMNTGHSPFLSAPNDVVNILKGIAR
jgi:pimeloyl-ACP methyl ester carboxylesterase